MLSSEDALVAESARQHLKTRRSLWTRILKRKRSSKSDHLVRPVSQLSITTGDVIHTQSTPSNVTLVNHNTFSLEDTSRDIYSWVVMYENQRGMNIFNLPYYSRLSLLPLFDPYPFTLSSVSHGRRHQPNVSLDQYSLPDGTWQWVSKKWMIDMRSDSGEVQPDGFEYNFIFRRSGWKPTPGHFGFVRRRRWIRLMTRPNRIFDSPPLPELSAGDHKSNNGDQSGRSKVFESDVLTEWCDDDESNWARCHEIMKRAETDGRKLEIWNQWLGFDKRNEPRVAKKQWTEDDGPLPSQVQFETVPTREEDDPAPSGTEHVVSLLKTHGEDLMKLFLYPESRVAFAGMARTAGTSLDEEVEFFSYQSNDLQTDKHLSVDSKPD